MVLSGENMATEPERSSIFPNLRWGIQRHMKCVSDDYTTGPSGGDSGDHKRGSLILKFANSSVVIPWRCDEINQRTHQVRKSPPKSATDSADLIEFKANWYKELSENTERDKIAKSLINKEDVEDDAKNQEKKPEEVKSRSEIKKRGRDVMVEAEKKDPVKSWLDMMVETLIKKDDVKDDVKPEEVKPSSETRERVRSVKFSLQLSKEEIEEDFMQNLGHRPQRRPRKRHMNDQKQVDVIPGLYLSEVTPDMYKVREVAAERKRRR